MTFTQTPELAGLDASTNGGVSATQRVGQLMQTYSWMPLQTLYGLVDSGLSDSDIRQTASRLTSAAVQNDQRNAIAKQAGGRPTGGSNFSFKQFFDDPVLQKAPSAGLALKQYLSGAVGSWPVSDQNLAHVQQQLQTRGYGRDLTVNGAWSPAWDAAHQQYSEALYNSHLSGDGGATISLKTAFDGLAALQPTGAFDALLGFVKSIPAGLGDVLGDVAGGAAQLGYSVIHPGDVGNKEKLIGVRSGVAADIKGLLGANTSQAKEADILHKHLFGQLVQDVSNIYLLTGIMGAGGRLANAIGEEAALSGTEAGAKLSADAAMRGPGVIARTLSTRTGTAAGARVSRALVGGVLGGAGVTASGSDNPAEIIGGIATGGALGYLSATNALRNIPVLGNTGPLIDSLADADGLYYKTRNLVAAPYKYAPVRVAGAAFQDATLLGAQARGLAALQSGPLGYQNEMTQGVQGERTFSAVDDAIKHRLDFTILGQHIAPSLDDLMFFLHGPTSKFIPGTSKLDETGQAIAGTAIKVPEARTSSVVGTAFNSILSAYHDALGDPGWAGAIERITGKSIAALIREAGGLANFNEFWSNKIADHAAYWAAENERNLALVQSGLPAEEGISSTDRLADLSERVADIRSNPDKLAEAIRGFRAQGNGSGIEQFVQRVNREIAVNSAGPKASEYAAVGDYMDAVRVARQDLQPRLSELIGEGRTASDRVLLNGVTDPGKFGIARLGTATRQDAYRTIHNLQTEWDDISARIAAPTSPAALDTRLPGVDLSEIHAWDRKTRDFLYRELGIDATQIPEAGAEKLDAARDAANHLAVDIIPHPDAPPELTAALRQLADLGYKPVSGTNIGHIITGASPVDTLEGPLTWQRRLAEHIGLNPNVYPNRTISQTRTTGIINAVNDAVHTGKVVLPPYWDANTVVAALQKDGFIDEAPGVIRGAVMHLFRTPERVAAANHIDVEAAAAELNHALMPRDIPRGRFVDAFTDGAHFGEHFPATQAANNAIPHELESVLGDFPPMSRVSAENLYAAIVKGSSDVPGYQLGAQRLEELFRSSLGFAGKGVQYRAGLGALVGAGAAYSVSPDDLTGVLAGAGTGATLAALGGDKLGWAMANLPNRLIQLRNEFRFELDPWFSLRRIAKVNAKLAVENITPTLNPLKAMQEGGTLNSDREVLTRVQPELHNVISDDADRYLQSQDVFGLYNHRNYEAYAAGQWARQGLPDDQIREKLIRTFEYGTGDVAGRSALERSANFVFFPFSFEKTVYRNLGGYLLDRPAQRMLLTRAISAYADFNQNHADNPLSTKFLTEHAPILQEAANLNMFAHGLSLGQPGGINRPLLNLFLPQSWSSSKNNLDLLKQFVPAVKNFSRLHDELTQQVGILQSTGINMWRDLKGIPATYGNPARSTLTPSAQLTEAFNMQREWYTNYQAVIDHNAKTQDPAQKVKFPLSAEWGRYAGEPITKTVIRDIIHGYYPAYSPTGAVAAATTNSHDFQTYLLDTKGTNLHDYVQSFATNAHNLASGMNSSRFSGQDVANYTAALRAQATYIAQQDSRFLSLYAKNFRKILGPLEAVS